jgi:hypothetical protein
VVVPEIIGEPGIIGESIRPRSFPDFADQPVEIEGIVFLAVTGISGSDLSRYKFEVLAGTILAKEYKGRQ